LDHSDRSRPPNPSEEIAHEEGNRRLAALSIPPESRPAVRRPAQSARCGRAQTTFASHYTRTLSLAEAVSPENIALFAKLATGEKYLINPSLAED
jgi:hypothetical protein